VDQEHHNICSARIDIVAAFADLRYATIMPWYKNVFNHLLQQPFINRSSLVVDIVTGLKHLHSAGLFHGNLRPENILVTDDGRACLADAGVNTLAVRAFCSGFDPVPSAWMYKASEELLSGIRDQRTDVYSFGCTIYAIYIAKPPFDPLRSPYFRGFAQIVERGHLGLLGPPTGMCEDLWQLLRACWDRDPARRPTMVEVDGQIREMFLD